MKFSILFFICLIVYPSIHSQILNGPMIGHVTFNEVNLWVQTAKSQNVGFAYKIASPSVKNWNFTATEKTNAADAFVSKKTLTNLVQGATYTYRVVIDGKIQEPNGAQQFTTQQQWAYRTNPKNFSFALGSCTYINEEQTDRLNQVYGGDYQIFNQIAPHNPSFMLWLGDNIYLRESDWTSKSGMQHRYTYTRNTSEMQALLANVPQYAIWDDHDFGPNNSDGSFINKKLSKEAFDLFWANPTTQPEGISGITNQFDWEDCQFFLLDNRYNRAPNDRKDGQRTILGTEQLDWFKNALLNSTASFKFVALGGQFLNTAPVFENYSANGFAQERQEIIDFIYLHQIKNVVFLTGDRHHSELSILQQEGKPTIYDLTVSPLTSGVHDASTEANTLREQGSHLAKRNYGVIHINGMLKSRELQINLHDSNGELLWSKSIFEE